MNVGNSVRKAIDEWELTDFESAMLHACNAVDGTAKKVYPHLVEKSNERFTKFLRDHYAILGPMGIPGINLATTRFPVRVRRPKTSDGQPDIADVIYAIHRCGHGHGDEIPDGFELIPDAAGSSNVTLTVVRNGSIRLSDRIVFALIAVAILSPKNVDQRVPEGYYLTYGDSEPFKINEWWGRAQDFRRVLERNSITLITMNFNDWMDSESDVSAKTDA